MRATAILALLSIQFSSAAAQTIPKSTLFLEAGGNGLFASFNYERQITISPHIAFRVGAGFYSEKSVYLSVPIGLNYLIKIGKRNSFIDTGFGSTWAQANSNLFGSDTNLSGNNFLSYVPSVSYRRYTNRRYMWRVSFTPVINRYGFVPWAGVSLGKGF